MLHRKKMLLHQKLVGVLLVGKALHRLLCPLARVVVFFSSSGILNTHVRVILASQEKNLIENKMSFS